FFSFIERHALIAIGLASSMVIARLLTPEQIGIYSVSLAVIGVAQVLRDFGLGNFLIQERNLTDAHIRTAFGLSLLIGFGLGAAVLLAIPYVASFYQTQEIVAPLMISALNFIVLPFGSISVALLRRELAFQKLTYVGLIASLGTALTSVVLAQRGYGASSMAVGAVVGNVLNGLGAWLAQSERRVLLPALSEWRQVARFGGQSSITSVVTTIAMDVNELALGKLLGFSSVALYSRAQGLMNLFHRDLMGAIRNVAFPAYSQAHREACALEPMYIKSVATVTVLAWPFYGFVSMYALEMLRLMFGPQWDSAAKLVPVFCFAGALAATTNLITSVLMAVGRIDLVTRTELVFQPMRAGVIVVVAVVFESLMACALAYLLSFALYVPFIYHYKAQAVRNDWQELLKQLRLSLMVSLGTLAVPAVLSAWAYLRQPDYVGHPLLLLAAAGVALPSWLLSMHLFKHPVTQDPLYLRLTRRLGHH
ncbi:MAG: lipopolysaccharide biosynthesis protein, partial [Rubrivivax sp.]